MGVVAVFVVAVVHTTTTTAPTRASSISQRSNTDDGKISYHAEYVADYEGAKTLCLPQVLKEIDQRQPRLQNCELPASLSLFAPATE
ncbi:hypothetical protein EV426DRAFT_599432 [Tirmania nivea]|nr:hypothetical protein EV426DRAFT_599432 [Tirmania nivea]